MNRLPFGLQSPGYRLPSAETGASARRPARQARRGQDVQPIVCATYVPVHYEQRYAYPLVVWLHGRGGNERDLLRRMGQLSDRNYIVLAPRGPVPCPSPMGGVGYRWPRTEERLAQFDEHLFEAVQWARRCYHVHSERIWIAGFCEGGTLAYRLGLLYPEAFAGVVALNAAFPRLPAALSRLRLMRHLRVFVGHGRGNRTVPVNQAFGAARLLHSAGLKTTCRAYSGTHAVTSRMLSDLDRWLIRQILE